MRTLLTALCASVLLTAGLVAQSETPPTSNTTTLVTELSPLNLVPPASGQEGSGQAEIKITLTEGFAGAASSTGVVTFVITFEDVAVSDVTEIAIYGGQTGTNGDLVLDSGWVSGGGNPSGGSTIVLRVQATSPREVGALRQILDQPENYYLLISTTEFPGGLLRGQLELDLNEKVDQLKSQLDTMEDILRRIAFQVGVNPDSLPTQ